MRRTLMTVSALALLLALPQAATAQERGRGNGDDDRGQAEDRGGRGQDRDNGRGDGRDRAERQERDDDNAGRGRGRGQGRQDRAEREDRDDDNRGRGGRSDDDDRDQQRAERPDRDNDDRGRGRPERQDRDDDDDDRRQGQDRDRDRDDDRPVVVVRDDRNDREFRDALRDFERRTERERRESIRDFERRFEGRDIRVVRRPDSDDVYFLLVRDRDRHLIDGCPPGLAWRNNGCLPPGQERRLQRAARYDWLWDRRDDDLRHHYVNGYVYRTQPSGGLSGWLPVLAGALGLNNAWPQQYAYEPVPQYYSTYYRLGDRYDYRYADGVVYGLDPESSRIQQVAALLTGQQWTVGQRMPSGYDVYNVPYAYRNQYRDTSQNWYRYNDGYVYQVDPTTRLVQAVIQLLT